MKGRVGLWWLPLLAGCFQGPIELTPYPCPADEVCPEGTYCLVTAPGEGRCLPRTECDLVRQDCPDPAYPQCASVATPNDTSFASSGSNRRFGRTYCLDGRGRAEEGESCTPGPQLQIGTTGAERRVYGAGECRAGLGCSADRQVCLRFCDSDRDCRDGEACVDEAQVSFCQAPCTPFGDDCPVGQDCKGVLGASGETALCTATGTVTLGQLCGDGFGCAAGLDCVAGRCAQQCDADHPCPDGRPCDRVGPLPNPGGVCGCRFGADDCPPGETCRPDPEVGAFLCRPLGENPRDASCGVRRCAAGLVCSGSDDLKACREVCTPDDACRFGACIELDGFPLQSGGVCACTVGDDSTCPSDQDCKYWGSSTDGGFRRCVAFGDRAVGDACGLGQCRRGAICIRRGETTACRAMCDNDTPCPGSQTCRRWGGLSNGGGLCDLP